MWRFFFGNYPLQKKLSDLPIFSDNKSLKPARAAHELVSILFQRPQLQWQWHLIDCQLISMGVGSHKLEKGPNVKSVFMQ